MKNRREYILAVVCIILAVLQLSLILLSWLLNAANAGSMSIRSMLSPEGIRWFFGHYADNMATPLLVWLILIAIASGTVKDSGINKVLGKLFLHRSNILFRERIALYFVATELIGCIVIMLLLTVMPHAILLSVNGELFPSSFSYSIIPVTAFVVVLLSVSYGLLSGTLGGIVSVFRSLVSGIARFNYVWFLYLLAMQLYCSIQFVFTL